MVEYKLLFKESVYKDLKVLSSSDLKRILSKIEEIAQNPRPAVSQKLSGLELFRVRQGKYRIVYSIQDRELVVHVIRVGHRKDVYR